MIAIQRPDLDTSKTPRGVQENMIYSMYSRTYGTSSTYGSICAVHHIFH